MDWSGMPVPPRYRILGEDGSSGSFQDALQRLPQGTWIINSTYTFTRAYNYQLSWDTVTEGWKEMVNKGEILSNDFLSVNAEQSIVPMIYTCTGMAGSQAVKYYGGGLPFAVSNSLPSFSSVLALVSGDTSSLRAEAVTSSFARADVSELEMLASLGEMPETVQWFRDVLKRLIAITYAVKRADAQRLLKLLKTTRSRPGASARKSFRKAFGLTENGWMELRYAIRPLVFEVQAYLAALESKIERSLRKTSRKKTFVTSTSSSTTSPAGMLQSSTVTERTTSRTISAGVLYSLRPESMTWFTHLGLDAPTSAVWAVTSLSFVYDWFFNIGDWIASWEPRLGLTPLTNWVVETRTVEDHVDVIPGQATPASTGWTTVTGQNVTQAGVGYRKTQIKARWVDPDRQILPTFRFKGLNTSQVIDLTVIGRKMISQLFR